MNITDYRHLTFSRIPDEVVDACARAAAEKVWAQYDEPLTDRDWANVKAFGAYHGRAKREHARARQSWIAEQQDPAKILIDTHIAAGQIIIDAISTAEVIETGDSYGYEWVADAPERIEAALREAGWKLTPL